MLAPLAVKEADAPEQMFVLLGLTATVGEAFILTVYTSVEVQPELVPETVKVLTPAVFNIPEVSVAPT